MQLSDSVAAWADCHDLRVLGVWCFYWQLAWRDRAAYNGISEFINVLSVALVALIFNWMTTQRAADRAVCRRHKTYRNGGIGE
jgi:hypothetical protein